jgi:hypothetical protein
MACPFDQATDRHPTPPLSPSTSSGSSRESTGPSFSASPSSHLPKDIASLHSHCPDSQPLGHNNPVIKLGRMPASDVLEDDTMMLDAWEGEGERGERNHGKHILVRNLVSSFSLPFLVHSVGVRGCLAKDVCNDGLVNWGNKRKICM